MQQLLVGVDVGCHKHAVAIGGPNGIVEQFEITHDIRGFEYFFARVSAQAREIHGVRLELFRKLTYSRWSANLR
ncbi:hypothetical protein [Pelosinus sp. IPA-1]|uniref:hypothetical protein n=1 Tax=Pelosinus sp. IPA-1 TaxID=3029569 RepID=UPI0024361721|nr:hypothetical protein [Pelosinus sp. IPA-1]GMA98769.1 hypothetical protein PIPA1_15690 [Pelosinus sp. IPA-1]